MSYITPGATATSASPTYGVALILYTGPASAPYTSFALISHVSDVVDIVTGVRQLLADLQRAGWVMWLVSVFTLSSSILFVLLWARACRLLGAGSVAKMDGVGGVVERQRGT